MASAHPPEFRRRAVELARQPGASVPRVAKDLGISESGLRRRPGEGLTSDERAELVQLCRDKRVREIDRDPEAGLGPLRAENVLPK
jgi:transposase